MKKTILKTILFLLSLNLLAQSPANLEDIPKVIVNAKGIKEGNNKVTREQLLESKILTAQSKLDSKILIISYDVTFSNEQGTFTRRNKGAFFNEFTINAIKKIKKGGIIVFSKIAIKKTGDIKNITIPESLIYKIIE